MTYLLYNLVLNSAFIASLPYTLLMLLLKKQHMRGRFGLYDSRLLDNLGKKRPVWLHAASMGEVAVLAPVIAEFKKRYPDFPIIVSTVTATGFHRAKDIIPEASFTFILPLDVNCIIKRVIKKLRPRCLIIAETELWPNLIRHCKNYNARVILINGKISARSFKRYRFLKMFIKKVLSYFDLLGVQSPADQEKLVTLGADDRKIAVLGNIKFDFSAIFKYQSVDAATVRQEHYLDAGQPVLVAGCTRPGEEKMVLEVYRDLARQHQDLVCIIAPRHLNRINEIEQILEQMDLPFCRKTKMKPPAGPSRPIIILDTMGELQKIYSMATVAFIGGSLFNFGGHNPLEPALFKVPVVFGPHMDNNRTSASLLKAKGGAIQVRNQPELLSVLADLFEHPDKQKNTGEAAYQVIAENRGIVNRYLSSIDRKQLIK